MQYVRKIVVYIDKNTGERRDAIYHAQVDVAAYNTTLTNYIDDIVG